MTLINRNQRIESAMRMAVRQRNYRRARDRALTRLAQAYPETYKELLELEKVSDETTGAKWVDIGGNNSLVVVARSGRSTENIVIETDGDFYEDEGDDE
jgi:predicted RNase H-like nuclease (RuvC/YqgF family)